MRTEVLVQMLKFIFQIINCIFLVSGTWDQEKASGPETEPAHHLCLSVPLSPPGSGGHCSWMFSMDPLQLRKPLECFRHFG